MSPKESREPTAAQSSVPRARRRTALAVCSVLAAKLLLAALSLALALLAVEVGTRQVVGARPLPPGAASTVAPLTGYFWVPDERLGFRNRPDGVFVNHEVLAQPLVTTDEHGRRRTAGQGGAPGRPTILIAGDSVVFSAEVPDDDTLPSAVARALADEGPVRVLNLGVRGYNTLQAKRALERALAGDGDVRLVLLVLSPNDLVENVNPVVYFPAVAPTVRWEGQAERFVEVEATAHHQVWTQSVRWFAARDRLPAASEMDIVRTVLDAARRRSAAANLVAQIIEPASHAKARIAPVTLADGSHGPVWWGTPDWDAQLALAEDRHAERALSAILADTSALCRSYGARLIVSEFTHGERKSSRPTAAERLSTAAGVEFVSVEDGFPETPETYMAATAQGFDGHYGVRGTHAFAAAIAPRVHAALRRLPDA